MTTKPRSWVDGYNATRHTPAMIKTSLDTLEQDIGEVSMEETPSPDLLLVLPLFLFFLSLIV